MVRVYLPLFHGLTVFLLKVHIGEYKVTENMWNKVTVTDLNLGAVAAEEEALLDELELEELGIGLGE